MSFEESPEPPDFKGQYSTDSDSSFDEEADRALTLHFTREKSLFQSERELVWREDTENDVSETWEVRIMAITWNMGGQIPASLENLLLTPVRHDVYVIGTQECMRAINKNIWNVSKKKWIKLVLETLGDDYELVNSRTLMGSNLTIFA